MSENMNPPRLQNKTNKQAQAQQREQTQPLGASRTSATPGTPEMPNTLETSGVTSAAPKTLLDVIYDVWQARFAVLVGLVCGCVAALLFVAMALPSYQAQMIVSPANPVNGAEVSSALADDNLAAVRYLVQRTGVTNSSDFIHFENIFYGQSVAALLLKDPAIMRGLSDAKRFAFSKAPSDWNAAKLSAYIQDNVHMKTMGATSLRRMTYRHPDRAFGTYLLHNIHRLGDELIRVKLKQDAGQRIRYLQQAVDETANPDHKRALTTLLLEQERLLMLASIGSPYAARVVEPPAVSAKPAWPDKMLVFPLFIMLGGAMGFAVFWGRVILKQLSLRRHTAQQEFHTKPERATYKPGAKYGYWWNMDHQNINQDDGEGGARDNQEKLSDEL